MRQIWQFIAEHGTYPVQTTIKVTRDVFNSISLRAAQDCSVHAQRLVTGGSPAPSARPAPGEIVNHIAEESSRIVGPMVVPQTVHDPRSVSAMTEGRAEVKKDPRTGEPLAFKPDSAAGLRMAKFFTELQHKVYTRKRILSAVAEMMDGKGLGEFPIAKFSADQIAQAKAYNDLLTKPGYMRPRKVNGKYEVIAKDHKPVRGVVDNGIELMTLAWVSCQVYQELLFGHGAVFEKMSIKHRARDEVLQEINTALAEWPSGATPVPTAVWEIDQTAMEMHCRAPGSLSFVLNIIDHISSTVCATYLGQHGAKYSFKTAYDREKGMRLSCITCTGTVPGGKQKTLLQFPDMYLDSGWLLTSASNFTLELAATFGCFVSNVEHLFAYDSKAGNFRVAADTFNWTFRSVPLPIGPNGAERVIKKLYMRGFFEGDDGIGRINREVATPLVQAHVTNSLADQGFSGKFKFVTDGRGEFIGAHFLVRGGSTMLSHPVVPDIRRYIGKIGVHAQSRANLSAVERCAAAKARASSLARMFEGKIEAIHSIFKIQAEAKCGFSDDELNSAMVNVSSEYDPLAYVSGVQVGNHTYGSIMASLPPEAPRVYPASHIQNQVVCNSLEIEDTALLGDLQMFAEECVAQCRSGVFDHEAAYSALPAVLRSA